MMTYDALGQISAIDDRLREQLHGFLREYLDIFFSNPMYMNVPVDANKAYLAMYYAAVGGWVTTNSITFLELLCPSTSGCEGEPAHDYVFCELNELIYGEYPAPIMAMVERFAMEVASSTGLPGVIQSIFPGAPIQYTGDDAKSMVVFCEHFNF